MQQLDARLFASRLHWPDRHWGFVMVPDEKQGFEFVTEDTVYLAPTADRTGQPLEPGRPSGTDPSCCRTCSGSGRER
jgi:hypothetical protein